MAARAGPITGSAAGGGRFRSIAGKLKRRGAQQRDEVQATVERITGELTDLAEAAMREADSVVRKCSTGAV
jgi:IS5 family transposase